MHFGWGLSWAGLTLLGGCSIWFAPEKSPPLEECETPWLWSIGGLTGEGDKVRGLAAEGCELYVCGNFRGNLDLEVAGESVTYPNAGDADVFVAKLSPAGETAWLETLGGTGKDACTDVAVRDGEVVAVGHYTGEAEVGESSLAPVFAEGVGEDLFVWKLAAETGESIWARALGSSDRDIVYRAEVEERSGRILIAGMAGAQPSMDGNVFEGAASGAFVVEVSAEGAYGWGRALSPEADNVLGIAIDAEGNAAIVGHVVGELEDGQDCATSAGAASNTFIEKLAPDGTCLWLEGYSGSDPRGQDVAFAPSGDLFVTGKVGSNNLDLPGVNIEGSPGGAVDGWLILLNGESGAARWARWLGGAGNDFPRAMALDAAGERLAIAAHFAGVTTYGGEEFTQTADDETNDLVLAVLAAEDGSDQVALAGGSEGRDEVAEIAFAGDSLIVTGAFAGDFSIAGLEATSDGDSDGFVAVLALP